METIAKKTWDELLGRAENGEADAQWAIGYYHEYGAVDESGKPIARVDPSEAYRWYALSASQGDSNAQCSLSNLLSGGETAERDYKAAIYWAKMAIAQGNATAAFNLGTIYRDQGRPAMAFGCYRRAHSMGDGGALLEVGLCYLFGLGTKQDFDLAYTCFEDILDGNPAASCQRTQENALYWMAILRLMGLGNTKKSVARARKMLEEANADDGHEQANDILNLIGKSRYMQTKSTAGRKAS